MKQRAVAIVADYLSHRPMGRVVGLKAIGRRRLRAGDRGRPGRTGPRRSDPRRSGAVAQVVQERRVPPAGVRTLRRVQRASTPTVTSTASSSATASGARPSWSRSPLELRDEQEAE